MRKGVFHFIIFLSLFSTLIWTFLDNHLLAFVSYFYGLGVYMFRYKLGLKQ